LGVSSSTNCFLRAASFAEAQAGMEALAGTFGKVIIGELFDGIGARRLGVGNEAGEEQRKNENNSSCVHKIISPQ